MNSKPRTVWLTSARIPEQFRDDLKAWSKRLGMSQSKVLEAAFYEFLNTVNRYEVWFDVAGKDGFEKVKVFATSEKEAITNASNIISPGKLLPKSIQFISCEIIK